jgi:hypothetical protein
MDLTYGLNAENRIVATSETWDSYALSHEGSECVSRLILYRSIWDFIAGEEMREFLGSVFEECRSREQDFSTLSRSNGPSEQRLLQMTVRPGTLGTIFVHHELIATSCKPSNEPVNLARHRSLQQCSICERIRIGENWISLQAVPNSRMFPRSHTVCPSCKAKLAPGGAQSTESELLDLGHAGMPKGQVVRFPRFEKRATED